MQYLFDFSKYTTNGIGYGFAYLAAHQHRRIWNYRAGVLFAVSGPLYMAGPIISRLIATRVGEAHRKWLKSNTYEAESKALATLEADHAALDKLCSECQLEPDAVEALVGRSGTIYDAHEKIFEEGIRIATNEEAKARLISTENVGAGLYVGASKLASGILFIIPGYYQNYNSRTLRASTVTNSDLFAAAVNGLPASSFAMLDTLRIQVKGELDRHKLAKAGKLHEQVAAAWLKQLDDMEKGMNQTRKPPG
jgi:hypothetical protein